MGVDVYVRFGISMYIRIISYEWGWFIFVCGNFFFREFVEGLILVYFKVMGFIGRV